MLEISGGNLLQQTMHEDSSGLNGIERQIINYIASCKADRAKQIGQKNFDGLIIPFAYNSITRQCKQFAK